MNAEFFQSWKGTLLIVAAVTVPIIGYKIAFRPSLETRIAERRIATAFPEGQPSEALRKRVIAAGTPLASLYITLDDLTRFLEGTKSKLEWEPGNGRAFVMRWTHFDPLTQQSNEIGLQLVAMEPSQLPAGEETFKSGAIAVVSVALNRELTDPQEAYGALLQWQADIITLKQQGRL
ncbi:hypothetical protein ASG42_11600 [Rhizobium sp. Leaf391]|uniref:hypothetical protein n=1 Tax=Rhizobium sp. Leaf391 TaxID=1736360 RepID=UPI00071310DF|nr:hypothetical protein [Rhizobium sp. Leaf391]KQS91122.1 hypothetical protein ASG42_11600 [Rhizobium sp. Leaf391]